MNSKIKIKIVKAAMRQGMLVLPHQAWGALWMPGRTIRLRLTLLALALVHWGETPPARRVARWSRLAAVLLAAAAMMACRPFEKPEPDALPTPTALPAPAATQKPAGGRYPLLGDTPSPSALGNFDAEPWQDELDQFCNRYPKRKDQEVAIVELKSFRFQADSALSESVRASCNYRERSGAPIKAIVLHATEGLTESALNYWAMPNTVASHYLVTREGRVIQVVAESKSAWHAGHVSPETCHFSPLCDGAGSINDISIGIEMENYGWIFPVADRPGWYQNGHGNLTRDAYQVQISGETRYYHAYAPQQIAALERLVADIRARNPTIEYVVGHKDVQAKTDPGPAFDPYWRMFQEKEAAPLH